MQNAFILLPGSSMKMSPWAKVRDVGCVFLKAYSDVSNISNELFDTSSNYFKSLNCFLFPYVMGFVSCSLVAHVALLSSVLLFPTPLSSSSLLSRQEEDSPVFTQ